LRPPVLAGSALIALLLAFGVVVHAGAQEPTVRAPAQELTFTGHSLAPGHWALDALRRADALMLLDVHLPAQRAVPLEVVERALREASERASGQSPRLARLAAGWHERLLEEFSGIEQVEEDGATVVVTGALASLGVEGRAGAAAPGLGEFEPDRTGAIALPDRTTAVGGADVALAVGRHFGIRVAPTVRSDGAHLEAMELTAGWGPIGAAAGRMPIGYAHGVGGGVALSGQAHLDAAGIATRTPLRLPSVLAYLGPVSFTTHFARMTEARHLGDPWFWSASGQFQPHRRLTLGIHRAAMFGGNHPEEQRVTFERVVDMLIGRVAGIGFEDQIVSASVRYELPTTAVMPLTAYLEWGAEDAAGAWWAVPARVIGLESASLPFLPEMRAGVEYAHFEPSCCSNPQWYRHWSFHGSWAANDHTLGHPLGGDGREAMAHASMHLLDARLRVGGRAFLRSRREENLFSPGRTGRSSGGVAAVAWRPSARTEIGFHAGRESGGGWDETNLAAGGRFFLR
jgi:hypothetical protein